MERPDFETLGRLVEDTKCAYDDNEDWQKEISGDVNKCIGILENWG